MALRSFLKWTHKGVTLGNGRCYKFKYTNYENDPNPHIFFLNAIRGLNPSTGHQWNLIQAVNLNYIPKAQRRTFVKVWSDVLGRSTMANFHLTWNMLLKRFPFMRLAIRRYLLRPAHFIQGLVEIKAEQMEAELLKNQTKDFSTAAVKKAMARK